MKVRHIKSEKLAKSVIRELRNKYPGVEEKNLNSYDYLMKRKKMMKKLDRMKARIFGDCENRNKAIREYEKAKAVYAKG